MLTSQRRLRRYPPEQRRVGVEQKVVEREPCQGDTQQVYVPALVLRRVPIEILDQQDGADGEREAGGDVKREPRAAGGQQQQIEQRHAADHQQGDQAHRDEHRRHRLPAAETAPIKVQDEAVPGGRAQQFERTRDEAERRLPRYRHRKRPGCGEQRGAGQIQPGAALLAPEQDQDGEHGVQAGADAVEHDHCRNCQDHAGVTTLIAPSPGLARPRPGAPVRRTLPEAAGPDVAGRSLRRARLTEFSQLVSGFI
jgi:hypothetical protein